MASDQEIISELVTTYKDLGSEELEETLHDLAREFDGLRDHAESLQQTLNDPQFAGSAGLKDLQKELKGVQREMAAAASEIKKVHGALQGAEEEGHSFGEALEHMGHQVHELGALFGLHFGVHMIHEVERFVEESIKLAEKNREEWGAAADAMSEDFKEATEGSDGLKTQLGELFLTIKEGMAFQGLNKSTEEVNENRRAWDEWKRTAAGVGVILGDWKTGFQGVSQTLMKSFKESLAEDDPIRQFLDNMSTESADSLARKFEQAQGIARDRIERRPDEEARALDEPSKEQWKEHAERERERERARAKAERLNAEAEANVETEMAREDAASEKKAARELELEKRNQQRIDEERAKMRDRAWFEELEAKKKVKEKAVKDDPFQASIEGLTDLNRRITSGAASARSNDPQERAAAAAEKTKAATEQMNKTVAEAFDVPLSAVKKSIDEMEVGLA